MFKKLLSLLLVSSLCVTVHGKTVIPGGESCGVHLSYEGVLITGSYAFFDEQNNCYLNENKFNDGDLIVACNNHKVTSINQLQEEIKDCILNNDLIEVTVRNNNAHYQRVLDVYYDEETKTFKTGLYIVDGISAIGTITYYDPMNSTFGAFGHPIDAKNECLDFEASEIFVATITSIEPNTSKATGKKIGIIEKTKKIGSIKSNTNLGIFGTYQHIYKTDLSTIETNEPKIGKAILQTTLTNNKIEIYDIYIEAIDKNENNILFTVTDQQLLQITHGIIPGMSGSPIIQDGKLVGAVTHVLVNDPTRGYGIFIENMLEAAG